MRLPLQALNHAQRLTEWNLGWNTGAMRASERTARLKRESFPGDVCLPKDGQAKGSEGERLPAYQTVWLAERTRHLRAKRRQDNT